MIFITPQHASVLSALIIIYYGIVVEKKSVSRNSAFFNTISFIVVLASIDLPVEVFLLLLAYTILGYFAVKIKWKRIYTVFGCKTFGSLMLVLVLGSQGILFGIYSVESVLISWIIVALIVNLIGYFYRK